jgi:general secretion pathway protein N
MRFLAAIVALALLAALAAWAPAWLLDARLGAASQGRWRLADTHGTVWNGRGRITSAEGAASLALAWTIDPLRLLRGDLALQLQPAEGSDQPRGAIAWRDATLALDGVVLALPAAIANALPVTGNALAFGGTVVVEAPQLRLRADGGDGAATARWSDARVAGAAGTLALGTVTVNAAPRNGRIEGRIENRGGDVRLDGEFAASGGGLDINARLTPLPGASPAVVRALAALGTPDAGGAVRVQWRGGGR